MVRCKNNSHRQLLWNCFDRTNDLVRKRPQHAGDIVRDDRPVDWLVIGLVRFALTLQERVATSRITQHRAWIRALQQHPQARPTRCRRILSLGRRQPGDERGFGEPGDRRDGRKGNGDFLFPDLRLSLPDLSAESDGVDEMKTVKYNPQPDLVLTSRSEGFGPTHDKILVARSAGQGNRIELEVPPGEIGVSVKPPPP